MHIYNAKLESMKEYKSFSYEYSEFHVFTRHRSIDKRSICSLSLTHVSHYTALITCEQASSTLLDTRDNSGIIITYI